VNAAYIGILTPGSTSRMRAECLRELTPGWTWKWIDTDPPMMSSSRFWRSLAFRANTGRAVDCMNDVVRRAVDGVHLDLAWVDKGVFLRPDTVVRLRRVARRLVHFTPDTAFHQNRSRHFRRSAATYDLLVTTKSFEASEYNALVGACKVVFTTQGYNARVHFPRAADDERRREAIFIGLAEPDRERCVKALLDHGVAVRLAGLGWRRFVRDNSGPLLSFECEELFGDAYANLLSRSWVGLGLLSKRFPELHTTRTFEIPACGAALATEATAETTRFLEQDEAVFFRDYHDLAVRLEALLREASLSSVAGIAGAGRRRILADGRDYSSILSAVLANSRIAL